MQAADYEVVEKLGEGSLGKTSLVLHRLLKRRFAMKELRAEVVQESGFHERLQKLAERHAALSNSMLLKIHTVSFSQGVYQLVMDAPAEAAPFLSLPRFLEIHPEISEEEIVQLLAKLARALEEAHKAGFAHGGLKPNDLLIRKEKGEIQLYISDFGLATLWDRRKWLEFRLASFLKSREEGSSFWQAMMCLPPELKRRAPESSEEEIAADIYAFGAIAYFLLMRNFPEGCFPLPSQHTPPFLHPWDKLITQCLQPDPKRRPTQLFPLLSEVCHLDKKEADHKKPILRPSELHRPELIDDPAAAIKREEGTSRFVPDLSEMHEAEPLQTEMIVIPAGSYLRGSMQGARDEMPSHRITLSSFAIDTNPVTNEQFVRFLLAMGGEKDHQNNDIIRLRESRIRRAAGKLLIESGYAKHPVIGATWYGALAYAKWVGKRLPTEGEWEVAARGGNEEALYPTGMEIERTQANFFSSDTTPVRSYPPNGYGLYDMAGNVYEWCFDWYAYNSYELSQQEPFNPKGPQQGVYRVLRGGCWKSLKEDLRACHRHRNKPGTFNTTYGFRCAADVEE